MTSGRGHAPGIDPRLFDRVGELADRAPHISDLRHHKLQLIAASRMRRQGEAVPAALAQEERRVAALSMATPAILRRVRAAYDGRIVLMKGAEVAALWPEPRLRPTLDVDLLVEDANAAQAALLSAGFVELCDPALYREGLSHHRCPLLVDGLPLRVEVHSEPHWRARRPPDTADIVAAAQPSALGIEGILAPRPDHHVLLLAGHAWAHGPLDRIGHLVDVASMLSRTTRASVRTLAEEWGLSGTWRATERAIDELLFATSLPQHAPVWKRHLADARERTVLETHVARIVAPVRAAPLPQAPSAVAGAVRDAVIPSSEETWSAKSRRAARAIRHAAWARSRHDDALDAAAQGFGPAVADFGGDTGDHVLERVARR